MHAIVWVWSMHCWKQSSLNAYKWLIMRHTFMSAEYFSSWKHHPFSSVVWLRDCSSLHDPQHILRWWQQTFARLEVYFCKVLVATRLVYTMSKGSGKLPRTLKIGNKLFKVIKGEYIIALSQRQMYTHITWITSRNYKDIAFKVHMTQSELLYCGKCEQ